VQITNENIILKNIGKKAILADVSFFNRKEIKPIVLFCHGYKGFKDWGAWNLVADAFANEGFIFVKFNFSHNGGTMDDPIDFPDEEAFGNNTYSLELEDTFRMVDWIEEKYPSHPIFIIGHSRGAGIATLAAAQSDKISKLCSWAGVCDYKSRFVSGGALSDWKDKGVLYVKNGRTKQDLPHFYTFYEDFVNNEEKLDIEYWTRKMDRPHLIIHGINDEAVSFDEAQNLHLWNPNSELIKLETNHTFSTKHPWISSKLSLDLKKVVSETIRFLRGVE
jgi:alpha/beta superfamily hydrolase